MSCFTGGGKRDGFGGNGIQTFIYVMEGSLTVSIEDETFELTQGDMFTVRQ